MLNNTLRPTRILFLCWGFSIHAKRRIQIFVDDPNFKVAVVSTYNYSFNNADNILLASAPKYKYRKYLRLLNKLINLIRIIIALINIKIRIFPEINIGINELKCMRHDLVKGVKDYPILKRTVNKFNPDLIFLQTVLYPCYLAYFLPSSLPVMITFWNGDVIWWAKWNGIDRVLKKKIVTYGVRRAKAITVNSKTALNACLSYGIRKDKIHLIRYPGVDLEHFKPIKNNIAKSKLGIKSKYVVLWPRGLGGYLNSDILVKAAAKVINKIHDVSFIVLLGPSGKNELDIHKSMALNESVQHHFLWIGYIQYHEMTLYYSCSDVVISISLNDSLPNVMLEAMVCKVPVIMGDIPQIREWIVDGKNGFLVPPRDANALSESIIKIFENKNNIVRSFTVKNLELVNKQADMIKNAEKIKILAHKISLNNV